MGNNPSTLRVRPRVGGFIMPRSGRAKVKGERQKVQGKSTFNLFPLSFNLEPCRMLMTAQAQRRWSLRSQ
jgi:hypothetical protein